MYHKKSSNAIKNLDEIKKLSVIWENELKDINDNDIERALRECFNKFEWAPNIIEFKKLCSSYKSSNRIPWVQDVLKEKEKEKDNLFKDNRPIKIIIDEGAKICKKIKEIYPDIGWIQIGQLFGKLKRITKVYYPDLNELNFLKKLSEYNKEDLLEVFNE